MSFNFMAAVTIFSDFRAPQNKSLKLFPLLVCTRTPQCDNPPLCVPSAQRDPTSQSDSTSHCDPASQRDSSPQCGPYQCDPSRQVPPPVRRNRVCRFRRQKFCHRPLEPREVSSAHQGSRTRCARRTQRFSSPLAPPHCHRRYSQSSPGLDDVTRSR